MTLITFIESHGSCLSVARDKCYVFEIYQNLKDAEVPKIRRNSLCPCGSNEKYKKCCGSVSPADTQRISLPFSNIIKKHQSINEQIRIKQQGLGNPIDYKTVGDVTSIAVGNDTHGAKEWATFADFLFDYTKLVFGAKWGQSEAAKPFENRNPILQWHEALYKHKLKYEKENGIPYNLPMTGVVRCYFGFAYSLYLLKHNAELQERLIARLKIKKQFQGAYYELIVANSLIRAGFKLELEDEADQSAKHCEFSARSLATGTSYWVEAKMRSVNGVLGKTNLDSSKSKDVTSQLTKHLGEALEKPAHGRRFIFIDVNAKPTLDSNDPNWFANAKRRLISREGDLTDSQEAYVFVTNIAFHRELDASDYAPEVLTYGLGLPDFEKPQSIRFPDLYRQKQKHKDAYDAADAIWRYPQIPDTFDGRPSSEAFPNAKSHRVKIGAPFYFERDGEVGEFGIVKLIEVAEELRKVLVKYITQSGDGKWSLIELTDEEFGDYSKYGRVYFGDEKNEKRVINDDFELYEWLVKNYSQNSISQLLKLVESHPEFDRLKSLDKFNLTLEVCEMQLASIIQSRGKEC